MWNYINMLYIFLIFFIVSIVSTLYYIKKVYPCSEIAKLLTIKRKEINKVRVRFAPSPTGFMHIGNIRTLLFNYFFAVKEKGQLILRIEDTDKNREDPRSLQYFKEVCKWLKIDFDESPYIGGKYGPYVQSQRASIYKIYIDYLLRKGYAYRAFDSLEELDEMKKKIKNFSYGNLTRYMVGMKNELNMKSHEIKEYLDKKVPYVVRLKIPVKETIKCKDYLRKEMSFDTKDMDDKVLWKSSTKLPTYHFASVIDDHLMKISHVIRGDEWLASLPYHIYLYKCLGWEPPIFIHTPIMADPEGKGKLSKRKTYDFPVFPISFKDEKDDIKGFREEGFSREGFINFLMLNGWNPGDDKEIMSVHEIAELFSIDRIKTSQSRFNYQKALFINKKHKSKSNGKSKDN